MESGGNVANNSPLNVNQQETIGPAPYWLITTKNNAPYFTFTLLWAFGGMIIPTTEMSSIGGGEGVPSLVTIGGGGDKTLSVLSPDGESHDLRRRG